MINNCAICRNHFMDLRIEVKLNNCQLPLKNALLHRVFVIMLSTIIGSLSGLKLSRELFKNHKWEFQKYGHYQGREDCQVLMFIFLFSLYLTLPLMAASGMNLYQFKVSFPRWSILEILHIISVLSLWPIPHPPPPPPQACTYL